MSHNPRQHLHNLLPAHHAPFEQARHHHQIQHHPRVESGPVVPSAQHLLLWRPRFFLRSLFTLRCRRSPAPLTVLELFLQFAFFCAVVRHTALGRALLTVRLPTAKRTAKIIAFGVTRICDEENAAMHASGQTSSQVMMPPQNRPQNVIVLQDQIANLPLAVPLRRKFEPFLDFYC